VTLPVYSWCFQVETLSAPGTTLVPLDPAFTWIIRDITGVLEGSSTGIISLEVIVNTITLWHFPCPQDWVQPFGWEGHVVVPGSVSTIELSALGSGGNIGLAVSGYKLTP
jgi:hypothetical protein